MATILPNTPLGTHPPETLRVFRALKVLPDTYTVWQRLGVGRPDFWVRRDDGASVLIAVCVATARAVREARQSTLFASQTPPGGAEAEALRHFVQALAPASGGRWPELLPGIVLFPNVSHRELTAALDPPPHGISWAAKENLARERLAAWLDARLGPPLPPDVLDVLRRVVTPEVLVPAQLTVRPPRDRQTGAELSDYLLSYNQEWVLKHDLDLSDEGEGVSVDLRVQLVNGVAGSGKSLVLLYRARLLRQFFPRKRILVLTHNKPLIRDLERRYLTLTGGDGTLEWRTFHGWCHTYWPQNELRPRLVRLRERADLVAQSWRHHLANTSLSPDGLRDEIDCVKDRLITTRQGYIDADRTGRGFALGATLRERVYDAILHYQAQLQEHGLLDYGDVPRRIWRALLEETPFPRYDVVLVDEAQFFAPIWFEIIKRVLTPEHGQLFLAADPAQGFLKRRQSWLASGLDVRGNSHRLRMCYRTTRAIQSFAAQFYQQRLPEDNDTAVSADVQTTADGQPPQLVMLTSEQDELTRVVNEVRALHEQGVPLAHILVIHADWQGAARVQERLRAVFGEATVIHPREHAGEHQMRVCPIDAATGLESPIVFLMGAHRLYEAEGSLRLGDEERAERVRDNTRRLYMAMTRAGQRLVLTYVGEPPQALLDTRPIAVS